MAHRDTSVTLVCATCGQSFHPWRDRAGTSRYCSRRCASAHPEGKGGRPNREQAATVAATRTARECPHCGRTFIPKRRSQTYCSAECARGHTLHAATTAAAAARETISEKRRAELLRRAAAGKPLESYRWSKQPSATRALSAPGQMPKQVAQAPHIPAQMYPQEPPPLPSIAENTSSDHESEAAVGGSPLTWPLQGAAARDEWMRTGELRAARVERALRREAGRGGAQPEVSTAGRTIVLAGQGSFLGIEGSALVCHQGRTHGAPAPERELLYPAMHGVKRIIWIGAHGHLTGTLTLAAAAWCRREGITLTVLDSSGEPLLVTVPEERHDALLHRQQWAISLGIAAPPAGAIVRELLRRKTEGQYRTLASNVELPGYDAAFAQLVAWREWLSLDKPPAWQFDIDHMRRVEARLSLAYFRAWEGWPLRWAKTDTRRIPPHWLAARARTSPLAPNGNARHAVDPVNACLNYTYGCLASQCRQSLLAENFDLACGFLHTDKAGRDSLTYDLMELERAAVDALVLRFLGKTTLHYGDFASEPSGKIMLHPQLTRLLLAECRVPQSRVDEHAHWLRRFLLTGGMGEKGAERDDAPAEAPNE